jgi:hypothetical protein
MQRTMLSPYAGCRAVQMNISPQITAFSGHSGSENPQAAQNRCILQQLHGMQTHTNMQQRRRKSKYYKNM